MSKRIVIYVFFALLSLAPAFAQDVPAPAMTDDPLTVSNVTIDKTDKNAVVAREAAIMEAKRTALQTLASRNLSPDDMKNFKPPADQVVSRLVKDFEIASEQLSATRYVANFTVRFLPSVEKYISVKAQAQAAAAPAPRAAKGGVLVLPYLQNMAGKYLLWEDANPWMAAWKSAPDATGNVKIQVPLGDAGDFSAGDAQAVWSGDYGPVEKLRANYGADEVIVVAANKSGPTFTLDLYSYRDHRFEHDPAFPLQAAVGSDAAVYKSGVQQILAYLKDRGTAPPPAVTEGAANASLVAAPPAESAVDAKAVPRAAASAEDQRPGPVSIDAQMNFDSFARWVEAQKRLSSVSPPVKLEIRAISSSNAAFTLDFGGNMATLKSALAEKNIALAMPVVEVDDSVLGGTKTTQRAVYELQLVN